MTQQVRQRYGNNRKATWALALAMVAAIAAVVIPIATGAPDKTYTMLSPSSGAVTPPAPTSGNTASAQNLCVTSAYTSVKVVITNTAKNAPLGSANVTFPANVTVTGAAFVPGKEGWLIPYSGGNMVPIRQLSLATSASVTISVALTTGPTTSGPKAISAVVKQSNDFNDSGQNPDANIFSQPAPPTITVQGCTKIAGNVYQDTNGNGAKDGSETAFSSPRTVTLSNGATTTTDSNGNYKFYVGAGTYSVCATAGSNEAQTQPSGNTSCGTNPSIAGYQLAPTTEVQGVDFGITAGVTGACDVGLTSSETAGATYGVTMSGSNCSSKVAGQKLVFTTWKDGTGQYASLRPTVTGLPPCNTSTGQNCVTVIEQLTWNLPAGSDQKPLRYDDTFPYDDFITMAYCKVDPRNTSVNTPSEVLPGTSTSCLIESSQKLVNGTSGWYLQRLDAVYSPQDGGRQAT